MSASASHEQIRIGDVPVQSHRATEGPSGLRARGFELRPPGRPPGPDLVPGRKSLRPERDALERLFERPPERPEDAGFFMGQRYLKSAGK